MKKQTPLEFAKEFINDIKENYSSHNFTSPAEIYFYQNILNDDPGLKTLIAELNKIGFDLKSTDDKHTWLLNKIT